MTYIVNTYEEIENIKSQIQIGDYVIKNVRKMICVDKKDGKVILKDTAFMDYIEVDEEGKMK